jgi:hypothetical protein
MSTLRNQPNWSSEHGGNWEARRDRAIATDGIDLDRSHYHLDFRGHRGPDHAAIIASKTIFALAVFLHTKAILATRANDSDGVKTRVWRRNRAAIPAVAIQASATSFDAHAVIARAWRRAALAVSFDANTMVALAVLERPTFYTMPLVGPIVA